MLGNVAPIWIAMLAAMKLGLVVIPAATATRPPSISPTGSTRGRAKFVVADAADAPKFHGPRRRDDAHRDRRAAAGLARLDDFERFPATFDPQGPTDAEDPLLLYFTSGTTARPKLVLHSHASYPIGHLSTMYGLGLKPGDHAFQHFLAGLGEARLVEFFRALERRRDPRRARRGASSPRPRSTISSRIEIASFCAPPTVWRQLIQLDLTHGR